MNTFNVYGSTVSFELTTINNIEGILLICTSGKFFRPYDTDLPSDYQWAKRTYKSFENRYQWSNVTEKSQWEELKSE